MRYQQHSGDVEAQIGDQVCAPLLSATVPNFKVRKWGYLIWLILGAKIGLYLISTLIL